MNNTINIFHALLDAIVALNILNRDSINETQYPINIYLKEFCTIKCNIGRQTGKTSYIKLRADENSLVIVCNYQLDSYFDNIDIVTSDQIKNGIFHDIKRLYTKVFIDEPSYVFKDISVDVLYKELAAVSSSDTTIIQLGA